MYTTGTPRSAWSPGRQVSLRNIADSYFNVESTKKKRACNMLRTFHSTLQFYQPRSIIPTLK